MDSLRRGGLTAAELAGSDACVVNRQKKQQQQTQQEEEQQQSNGAGSLAAAAPLSPVSLGRTLSDNSGTASSSSVTRGTSGLFGGAVPMVLKRGYSTDDTSAALSPSTEQGARALLADFVEDNSSSQLIPLHNFLLASGSSLSSSSAAQFAGKAGGSAAAAADLDVQAISLERMEKAIAAALLQHSRLVQLATEAATALRATGAEQFNIGPEKFRPIQRCYNVITEIRQLLCEGEKTNVSLHVLTQYVFSSVLPLAQPSASD
jgi:hypothetical protein